MNKFLLTNIFLAFCCFAHADTLWIDSQNTSQINAQKSADLKIDTGAWGRTEFLRDKNWLFIESGENGVEKGVPDGGVVLRYDFEIQNGGVHQIWNRIGFEFARSRFEWRLDGENWNSVSPDDLTTDLMALGNWAEIAWLQLGQANLSAGKHALEIRLPKEKNGDKWKNIRYASDALVIAPHFVPNGALKPGETARTARDEAASNHVFAFPKTDSAAQTPLKLGGDWEVAREDEQLPTVVAAPMELPKTELNWSAIAVPGDKNALRSDLEMAHRLWFKTRVNVPPGEIGRSFALRFPLNSLLTTVYVNRQFAGFSDAALAPCAFDVTKQIRAGENEILVGIKDSWYGRKSDPARPMLLRKTFNLPRSFFTQGFQELDYPVWNGGQTGAPDGILNTPVLTSAGRVYVSDVFVMPDVQNKTLRARITLKNTTDAPFNGSLVGTATGKPGQRSWPGMMVSLSAGEEKVFEWSAPFPQAKIWWPNDPQMTVLTVKILDGQGDLNDDAVDERKTRFGFRQWTTKGYSLYLNGVKWPVWAELVGAATKEAWLADYRRKNQRTARFFTPGQGSENTFRFYDLDLDEALQWGDENGVVWRVNGPLDGQRIGYQFVENDEEIKKQQGGSRLKERLLQNWEKTLRAQVGGWRNHASVNLWTIENEFAYINLINLLGNSKEMDDYEKRIAGLMERLREVDPTRLSMTDGGGAGKENLYPVHGDHYVFEASNPGYPDLAYTAQETMAGRGRWTWDKKRPRYAGEDYFATGINPADYAQWGGEIAFAGKAQSRAAAGRVYRMLQEGYRWGGFWSGWHFWIGENDAQNQYGANPWRAVFCRQWDWSFGSGQTISRTYGLFNDTQFAAPLTFSRTLLLGNKVAWTKKSTHAVPPGESVKFSENLPIPTVKTRVEAVLVLKLEAEGQEIYRDQKAISILPNAFAAAPNRSAAPSATIRTVANAQIKPQPIQARTASLLVFDPSGKIASFLRAQKVAFTPLNSLENLPNARVLLLGPDALSPAEATSSRLAAWASSGRSIVVLEQKNPLRFQALPAPLDLASETQNGGIAFIEDASNPLLKGLSDKDFFGWKGGVFRDAYAKPGRGARSLVQAGKRLSSSVLLEVPTGRGVALLSQLEIGENLAQNVVAQTLLANLLSYARTYQPKIREVTVASADAQFLKALDGAGIRSTKGDLKAALAGQGILIVAGTPQNLATLRAQKTALDAFFARGGYVVLQGVGPEGLRDFNALVGFNHMMRPFGRERVTFGARRDSLMAGVPLGDIVLLSGQRIFGWTSDEYLVDDMFSHVVDFEDVAPFAKSDFFAFPNIVNGFTNADGWPLIINFEVPKNGQPYDIKMNFDAPQTIRAFSWQGNTNYFPQTEVRLRFDGKNEQIFATQPNGEAQNFEVNPAQTGREITLSLAKWQEVPGKTPNLGIDNISLLALRDAKFYERVKPMVNVGGLMHYPRGKGGLVLCNLLFKENEAVPINATKKRNILGAILRNLSAPSGGGEGVIAGQKLDFQTVSFAGKANIFRNERGWFGDANRTFAALPTGKNQFAGVSFEVYDFPTSPVPTAILASGEGVKGLEIGGKARALFFLQTAKIERRRNADDLKNGRQFEAAKYLVNYADGSKIEIPVLSEIDVENFAQKEVKAIPGAQIAWSKPYENSDEKAVAYLKSWNNPKPDVAIQSVDVLPGKDAGAAKVVLLALSAAK